jgi:membrane fusion protein (multidrug efflux system)
MTLLRALATLTLLTSLAACGGHSDADAGPSRPHGMPGGMQRPSQSAAVPVQVDPVTRASIAQSIETNGVLEAEQEVDLVARTSGPITEILIEEGDTVKESQLLARLDDREARNQVAIARVSRDEAKLAFDRAKSTWEQGLVSQEAYDSALSRLQATEAQLETATIQLSYTEIRAPFDALIVIRYVKLAQHVGTGTALFRVSDFTPLLCPIQLPEKSIGQLRIAQPARIRVESFPERDFDARVLRIRPTVDPATGTVTVTLEVQGRGMLRPGMFASVFLEVDRHDEALVIPRSALVLDSIGDTVFVREDAKAARREVRLGFRDQDRIEVLEGLAEGDELVVLGQDGLADGTPVTVLGQPPQAEVAVGGSPEGPKPGGPSPEMEAAIRQRMKDHGLTDQEIDERLKQMREQGGPPLVAGSGPPGSRGLAAQGGPPGEGGLPPRLEERIREATTEELGAITERMRSFGMTDEQIEGHLRRIRGDR